MTPGKVTKLRGEPPRAEPIDMPETIQVGPKIYEVICEPEAWAQLCVDENDLDIHGLCDPRNQRIYIQPAGIESRRVYLSHEVGHALLEPLFPSDLPPEVEERVCHMFGFMLPQIIRDNPDLVAFLQGVTL